MKGSIKQSWTQKQQNSNNLKTKINLSNKTSNQSSNGNDDEEESSLISSSTAGEILMNDEEKKRLSFANKKDSIIKTTGNSSSLLLTPRSNSSRKRNKDSPTHGYFSGGGNPYKFVNAFTDREYERKLRSNDDYTAKEDLFIVVFGIISLVLSIIQVELTWRTVINIPSKNREQPELYIPGNSNSLTAHVIQCCASGCILLCILGLIRRYYVELKVNKERGVYLIRDSLFSTGLYKYLFLEILIVIIQPIPFTTWSYSYELTANKYVIYQLNDILTAFMIPRVYLLFRLLKVVYNLGAASARSVAVMYRVEFDTAFIVKTLCNKHPFSVIILNYLVAMCCYGYAIQVFERSIDIDFRLYKTGIWVVLTTMTTVGYGDIYPTTDGGRIVAMLSCAHALFNLGILFYGVNKLLTPTLAEEQIMAVLARRAWTSTRHVLAAKILQAFWRCASHTIAPNEVKSIADTIELDGKLAAAIREFRYLRNQEPVKRMNIEVYIAESTATTSHINKKMDTILHILMQK